MLLLFIFIQQPFNDNHVWSLEGTRSSWNQSIDNKHNQHLNHGCFVADVVAVNE